MESFEQRPTGEQEETIMLDTSTSAMPDQSSNSHTAFEECLSSMDEVVLGDASGASSSAKGRRSEYFSARTEEVMHSRSQFSSDVEHEIEHSRVHWSEVIDLADLSEDDNEEEVNRKKWKLFEELMSDPRWTHPNPTFGHFFLDGSNLKLGGKIAEGGEAEIFEFSDDDGDVYSSSLLKVFKRGSKLSLRKQWPLGVLQRKVGRCLSFGLMLNNGRFAFCMMRCWGDLRKLIDQAMQEKNNQGPPFPYDWEGKTLRDTLIMKHIARWMKDLHENGVVHRDLKASNILLHEKVPYPHVIVADFECLIGVVGTTFWRAPEILLGLKNRKVIDFSEKVYSYGMTCFEIIIGRLPFEGELEPCRASYDLIIEGQRPKLPSDLNVNWKDLIQKCWNPDPIQRPTFLEIVSYCKLDELNFCKCFKF